MHPALGPNFGQLDESVRKHFLFSEVQAGQVKRMPFYLQSPPGLPRFGFKVTSDLTTLRFKMRKLNFLARIFVRSATLKPTHLWGFSMSVGVSQGIKQSQGEILKFWHFLCR